MQRLTRTAVFVALIGFSATAAAGMPSGGPLTPEEPPLQDDVTYDMLIGRKDPVQPTFTVTLGSFDTGTVTATINGATETVGVQKTGFPAQTFTMTQIAQYQFPGNFSAQTEFRNNLTEAALDNIAFTSFEVYSDRSGTTAQSGVVDYNCAFVPCRQVVDPADRTQTHWVMTYRPDWPNVGQPPTPEQTYPGYSPEIVAYDRARWEQERREACSQTTGDNAVFMGTGTLTGLSCAFFETGFGAIGCVAGLVATVSEGRDAYNTERICYQREYPGPGNW